MKFFVLIAALLLLGCVSNNPATTPTPTGINVPSPSVTITPSPTKIPGSECSAANDCIAAGCSGQLCVSKDSKQTVSVCEYKEEYACFDQSKCGCDAGKCQWNNEVKACVFKAQEISAVSACISQCERQQTDLRAGPCLSEQIMPDWVCGVAHSPREAVDALYHLKSRSKKSFR